MSQQLFLCKSPARAQTWEGKCFANSCRVCCVTLLLSLSMASFGAPAIKTQQCSVKPTGHFELPGDIALSVANRNNTVTTYISPQPWTVENPPGWLTGPPALNLGGSATGLSLVSKNIHAGLSGDDNGHLYVVNPGLQTVTVYRDDATSNTSPLVTIRTADGLSQPSGLAVRNLADGSILLYVANTGNSSISAYVVTFDALAGAHYLRLSLATPAGLSAPLGLAINDTGSLLYVANKGSNKIGVYATGLSASSATLTPVPITAPLASLSGPMDIALSPSGNVLYVANSGKYNGWYNVTAYQLDANGVPLAQPVAVISGNATGLCNPAALVAGHSVNGDNFLAVANRESSGGSITFYRLNPGGLPANPPIATSDPTNIPPEVMMLHDSINLLGAPVGISF